MVIQEFQGFFAFVWQISRALMRPMSVRWNLATLASIKMIQQSIPTVLFSGVFVGAIMSIVFENQLSTLRATSLLGALASSATLREVAPLLIAFMLSGKCGAFASSEISSMKATDQLDSLQSLGLSDFDLIILPRVIGIFVAVMFTLFIGLFSSLCGAMIMALLAFDIHPLMFFNKFDWLVNWTTLGSGFYKCFMFGLAISTISCYAGYRSEKSSAGVGRAVQVAAISNMLSIILLDSFTTHTYDILLRIFYTVIGD